jgi:hypothetical protein
MRGLDSFRPLGAVALLAGLFAVFEFLVQDLIPNARVLCAFSLLPWT